MTISRASWGRFVRFAILCLVVLVFFVSGCRSETTHAKWGQGVLDLDQWDFSRDGNVKLDGEWEFYWNRLLTYQELGEQKPDLIPYVPSTWNTYSLQGKTFPRKGMAPIASY